MNRHVTLLIPPLAFLLGTLAGWLAGTPSSLSDGTGFRTKVQQRGMTATESDDLSAALHDLESQISLPAHPEGAIRRDAAGMEAALDSDAFGGGMRPIEYANRWAEDAPEEMFQWLSRKGGSSWARTLFPAYQLFSSWAETDMDAALAAVDRLGDPQVKAQAVVSTLGVLCQSNPDRARELMMRNLELFDPSEQGLIFSGVDGNQAMCDVLGSLPPGAQRTNLLAQLLNDVARNARSAGSASLATAVWNASNESQRRELVAAGFTPDPSSIAGFTDVADIMRKHAEASDDPAVALRFIASAGPDWATRDLPAAVEWTQVHMKGRTRIESGAGLFQHAVAMDPDAALSLWQSLPDGPLKDRGAKAIADGAPADRKEEVKATLEQWPGSDGSPSRPHP